MRRDRERLRRNYVPAYDGNDRNDSSGGQRGLTEKQRRGYLKTLIANVDLCRDDISEYENKVPGIVKQLDRMIDQGEVIVKPDNGLALR